MTGGERDVGFEVVLQDTPRIVLFAERLRDGRVVLGTREQRRDGEWTPGELQILEPRALLALAAGIAPWVHQGWIDTVRERQPAPLATAAELYGGGTEGVARLAMEMVGQIPPSVMVKGLILLANSIGPEARERLVQQLNRTTNRTEDTQLRRRLSEEEEAFAYAVAAAGLFDAIAQGLTVDTGDGAE